MEVLLSNDWLNYKPEVILIECLHSNLEEIGNIEAVTYLRQLGYKLFAKTFNTLFFSIKSDA